MRSRRETISSASAIAGIFVAACTNLLTGTPQTASPDAAQPTLEAAGFGSPADGYYLWVGSIVRDVQPGQPVTVSFNLLSADGKILVTVSTGEEGVNPNQRIIIGTLTQKPDGLVAKVEPTLYTHDIRRKPEFTDVVLEIGEVTIGEDSSGNPTANALITNPSQQTLQFPRIGVACSDGQGNIIGGGSDYPELLPAGGQINVSADILVSEQPARCEMTAQPKPR
jgi:hypothetical protein